MTIIALAGQQTLTQWDVGRKLVITEKCSSVHYANPSMTEAIVCNATENDGVWMAPIPDEVLQVAGKLRVYVFVAGEEGYTREIKDFLVKPKPKPENYIYTPTDAMTWEGLHDRIEALEESGGAAGGYYTPKVTQTAEDRMQISFDASQTDMPTVAAQSVTLPAGKDGAAGPQGDSAELIMEFQISYSDVQSSLDNSKWSEDIPQMDGVNKYLWTRITIISGSAMSRKYGIIGMYGEKGEPGATGPQGNSAEFGAEFQVSSSNQQSSLDSDGWSGLIPDMDATNKYLWARFTSISGMAMSQSYGIIGVYEPGATGPQGPSGKDGVSPDVTVSKSGSTTTITVSNPETGEITSRETIEDGNDGKDGADGADGQRGQGILYVTSATTSGSGTGPTGIAIKYKIALSTVKSEAGVDEVLIGDTVRRSVYLYPVANVDESYVYLGAYTSIKGTNGAAGEDGADGYTPVKGVDYWTDADKEAMVQDVMEALGSPVLGSVDEDKNIILSGDLASGTYTIMYENADGSRTAIGSLKVEGAVQYTNVLPTAEDISSTDPYNGTGYKNGCYLSGSNPFEGTDAATVLTGNIPYTVPATGLPEPIYIKGSATWSTSNTHCRMRFFAADKIAYSSGFTVQGSNIPNYFTVEELGENYIKLTPVASGNTSAMVAADSTITDKAYIRMSLVGTGDDLIITIGEPIE